MGTTEELTRRIQTSAEQLHAGFGDVSVPGSACWLEVFENLAVDDPFATACVESESAAHPTSLRRTVRDAASQIVTKALVKGNTQSHCHDSATCTSLCRVGDQRVLASMLKNAHVLRDKAGAGCDVSG